MVGMQRHLRRGYLMGMHLLHIRVLELLLGQGQTCPAVRQPHQRLVRGPGIAWGPALCSLLGGCLALLNMLRLSISGCCCC